MAGMKGSEYGGQGLHKYSQQILDAPLFLHVAVQIFVDGLFLLEAAFFADRVIDIGDLISHE